MGERGRKRSAGPAERIMQLVCADAKCQCHACKTARIAASRALAAVRREEREAAAERGVEAALKHSSGARSTSSDFEYAIRAALANGRGV